MADTETKVVKAQTKKSTNTAGEGPKVQIRAVDKAIIEAQQARKAKPAARAQSAAKAAAETPRPMTPPIGKPVPKAQTAAAKPFGSIDDNTTVTWNGEFPLVAPAFTDVRLVMLGAFNEGSMGMADREWVTHTRDHIQPPDSVTHVDGCRYCAILKKWENRDFRAAGAAWIEEFGEDQCRRPTGGGGPPGGGTRHAH